ncbi:hypothetical protein [Haliangium ochraceum]|uniref:Uncharacterized protein n=1 Tax=Haliangium ochraceum (strain DSM 14365 / JCM 11303 / SMP-2) TaxID=502025 RepID=D0LI07_HALO1|nr:hypothetical protein [Haliangium ochraceum]ACY14836.1 hypothetical protein Hoch_2293 [Haliangium ochraceum DSM 14365]
MPIKQVTGEIQLGELPEAKGAWTMRLSADQRWLLMGYRVADQRSFWVRLDREGNEPLALVWGAVVDGPRDDGTVLYVEPQDANGDVVAWTKRTVVRSQLKRLGSPEPLLTRDSWVGMHYLKGDRIAVLQVVGEGDENGIRAEIVDLASKETLAGPVQPDITGYWQTFAHSQERLLFLVNTTRLMPRERQNGYVLVAFSTDDLGELWRTDGIGASPAPPMYTAAALTDEEHTVLLYGDTVRTLPLFDAATGEPKGELSLPLGSNRLRVIPAAKPRPDAALLWSSRSSKPYAGKGWQVLVVRDDHIEVVAEDRDALPPTAGVWAGDDILLAPSDSSSRVIYEREHWSEPFKNYYQLAERQLKHPDPPLPDIPDSPASPAPAPTPDSDAGP